MKYLTSFSLSIALVAALLFAGLFSGQVMADAATCDDPGDFSIAASKSNQDHVPVLMVFNSEHCGYCELMEKEVLKPMLDKGELNGRAVVAHFDIGTGGKITDFDGERVRARRFVERYQVFATPTVVVLDSKGEPLATAIVGYDNADAYRRKLVDMLDQASARLQTGTSPVALLSR